MEVGNGARANTRAIEEGESVRELTAVAERVSVGSGEVGRRRGIAGDLGGRS